MAMRRREFITLLGGTVVAWPAAARAQQAAKVPVIGALVIGNVDPSQFWQLFRQGLRDLGYSEGQNIRFEFRSAEGEAGRLPELADELVRLNVDMIVTWFTPPHSGGKASDARNPHRYGGRGRSGRHGAYREPPSARRKCHRDRWRHRRTGWQVCRTDPRNLAVGTPRGSFDERNRSVLQAIS
jgi:putative ABC transport system substrate-binding protein